MTAIPHIDDIDRLLADDRHAEARAVLEHTLTRSNLDYDVRLRLGERLSRTAPLAHHLFPGATFHRIDGLYPLGWHGTNPSVHPQGDDVCSIVRIVNYQRDDTFWSVLDNHANARTISGKATFRPDLTLRAWEPIHDHTDVSHVDSPVGAIGFEDMRLFRHDDQEFAVACRYNRSPNHCQQLLVRFDSTDIVGYAPLSTVNDGTHKNWMPVLGLPNLVFVDMCDPLRLRHVDLRNGTPAITVENRTLVSELTKGFRGGSQLVPFGDGWLSVVHEVVQYVDLRRLYLHRIVQWDRNVRIVGFTPQFSFVSRGIEFCAGLRVEADRVIVSFGVGDATAWIGAIPLASLTPALIPLEARSTPEPAFVSPGTGSPDRPTGEYDLHGLFNRGNRHLAAGDRVAAVHAFRACADRASGAEIGAWACYREASIWLDKGNARTAMERCAAGMVIAPWLPELPTLAARAAIQRRLWTHGIAFADLAIVHGAWIGERHESAYPYLHDLASHFDEPHRLRAEALTALGRHDDAAAALEDAVSALGASQASSSTPPTTH